MLAAKVHGHDGCEAPDDQIGSVDDDPFLRVVTRLGRVSRHRDFLEIWRVPAGFGGACVAGILGASSVAEFVSKISNLCFRYYNTTRGLPDFPYTTGSSPRKRRPLLSSVPIPHQF